MEKFYDNDGINIYMALKDVDISYEGYEIGMLKNNHMSYLADMEIRAINGVNIPYYNVSGLVEFKSLMHMGCMEPEIIINLIRDVLSALSELTAYLLSINNLLLDEEHIFYDMSREVFCFIYVPELNLNIRQQIRILLENNMMLMNHENADESGFVYALHEICTEDNFDLKRLEEYIEAHMTKKSESARKEALLDDIVNDVPREEDSSEKEKLINENNMYSLYKLILAVAMGITLFFGVANICIQYSKMGCIYDMKLLMGVLLLLVTEIFVFFEIVRKQKEEDRDMNANSNYEDSCENDAPIQNKPPVYRSTYILMPYGKNINAPIYINQNYLVIGRGNDAGFCLKNSSISRMHAKIYELQNQLVIEDMGSTNGTFVNNYPVKEGYPAVVFPGDVIRFGSEEYQIVYE